MAKEFSLSKLAEALQAVRDAGAELCQSILDGTADDSGKVHTDVAPLRKALGDCMEAVGGAAMSKDNDLENEDPALRKQENARGDSNKDVASMNRDELNAARKSLDAERAIYRAKGDGTGASAEKMFSTDAALPAGPRRIRLDTRTLSLSHPLAGCGDPRSENGTAIDWAIGTPVDENFNIDSIFHADVEPDELSVEHIFGLSRPLGDG